LSIVLACAIAGVVIFGIYPDPLIQLAAQATLPLK
jgi:NADH-quinone oxidoreductase subunit N